jgi:hypothetical protein
MKRKLIITSAIALSTLTMSFAYASNLPLPMAQRNCSVGGDLQINKETITVSSQCTWLPNDDSNMQITLHVAKDVDFVAAHCTFLRNQIGSTDAIEDVKVSKAGNSDASAQPRSIAPAYKIINGNNIDVIIRNYNNDPNLNVLFYINNARYTPGDQIICTFSAINLPT